MDHEQPTTATAPKPSYAPLSIEEGCVPPNPDLLAQQTLRNFTLMSILFSANHGCVVACLGLATARLGSVGATQSGILYGTYTLSALLGATYLVKRIGSRNAMITGMSLYIAYVGCFALALHYLWVAYVGAVLGGIGAGFLWTAQGAYFSSAAEEHARLVAQPSEDLASSTSILAGTFAFWYLLEEVALRMLSTVLLELHWASWEGIFGLYTLVTIISTGAMVCVHDYSVARDEEERNTSIWYKVTAAGQLLVWDPKMKYMLGLNAAYGFASAFLNSYVNGEVIPVALNDPDSMYIGILTSGGSAVAAGMSLWFGKLAKTTGKGPILISGALSFFCVAFPFVLWPDARLHWGWFTLMGIYTCMGVGRATFEGTLKATFADYFAYEKEGAFANITLQSGLSGAIGYILTFGLSCDIPGRYCIEYRDASMHNIFAFESIVMVSSILAVLGYLRASTIFVEEIGRAKSLDHGENDNDSELSKREEHQYSDG